MKTNFLLNGAVFLTLLALACPWQAVAEASGHKKKPLLPVQAIDTGCEAFIKRNKIKDVRECTVSETGTIGTVDGQTYDYALYGLDFGDLSASGLSIFFHAASDKQVKLLFDRYNKENAGSFVYEQPAMATHSFGTLLHVPIRVDGTGHFNESEYAEQPRDGSC
ncbi:MAG: hypothetical protein ACTFAL_07880 [Candidatus Electronema sp. V4]|uniref:hypothetical protein n=1 Tax=Candidatus Electronema sp. V4 TaxID=3454756 RepID=UPI00405566EC